MSAEAAGGAAFDDGDVVSDPAQQDRGGGPADAGLD
jgi:hypothetical protein